MLAFVLAGCGFPTPSQEFACQTTNDCASDRVCEQGFCVLGREATDAGNDDVDADPVDTMPPVDADPFAAIEPMCIAAGYTKVDSAGGGYYRTVTSGKSWLNALSDCSDDVPNASHLIVLSTQLEATYMKTQLGWIGLTDRNHEGMFVTATGETDDVRPFSSGQPDNGGGNENCVQMKSDGLDDDQCGNSHRYVCECDGRMTVPGL